MMPITNHKSIEREEQGLGSGTGLSLGYGAALVLSIAVIKVIVTMLVGDRYGWHRDELYYLACARHPALGYVDFPPVTPLLARLDGVVLGVTLPGLRLLSVLAGAAVIVLAAGMAHQMGGNTTATALTALAVLLNPLFLGGNLLFQTVSFDQLAWVAVLSLLLRLLLGGHPRLWLLLGVTFGVGLETKYTIAALGAGLLGGLLIAGRAHLRPPWPWLGAAIAIAILLPNLLWQIQHGWASLSYIHSHAANTDSRVDFLLQTLLILGPIGIPLVVLGFIELFTRPRLRVLGWTCALTVLVLFLTRGKAYYSGPLVPVVIAAGTVRAVRLLAKRLRALFLIAVALVLLTLPLLPLGLPILPARTAVNDGLTGVRKDYADMFGWREMTASVARVYHALPTAERRRAVIWGINYGEAGALDLYGPQFGLPHAISTHLTYYYWKPKHVDDRTVIVIGGTRSLLTPLFADVRPVAVIRNAYAVHNEEYGRKIFLCRRPKVSLDGAWPSLRFFD